MEVEVDCGRAVTQGVRDRTTYETSCQVEGISRGRISGASMRKGACGFDNMMFQSATRAPWLTHGQSTKKRKKDEEETNADVRRVMSHEWLVYRELLYPDVALY